MSFLELGFFLFEFLGVKLEPGIKDGAVVEGCVLEDGVAMNWYRLGELLMLKDGC